MKRKREWRKDRTKSMTIEELKKQKKEAIKKLNENEEKTKKKLNR